MLSDGKKYFIDKEAFLTFIKSNPWVRTGCSYDGLTKIVLVDDKLISINIHYHHSREDEGEALIVAVEIFRFQDWDIYDYTFYSESYDKEVEMDYGYLGIESEFGCNVKNKDGIVDAELVWNYVLEHIGEYDIIAKEEYYSFIEKVKKKRFAEYPCVDLIELECSDLGCNSISELKELKKKSIGESTGKYKTEVLDYSHGAEGQNTDAW